LRYILILVLLLSFNPGFVSAQDKVYPNMPFRVFRLNNGFVMGLELQAATGPAIKNDSLSGNFAGITVLGGYQISRNFVASLGTGFSLYRKGSLVPVFLDIRYAITTKRLSPYIYADYGLLLDIKSFDNTKTFINPGLGIQYSLSNDLAFVFSSGAWIQRGDLKLNSFVNFKAGMKYRF
jgi:hypothetical protein